MATRPPARAAWLLVVAWAALILIFSLTPSPPGAGLLPDKVVHAAAYAALALLLRRSLQASSLARPALLAVVAAFAYGASVEVMQGLLPWRGAEWWDLGANALGAVAGALPWRRRA